MPPPRRDFPRTGVGLGYLLARSSFPDCPAHRAATPLLLDGVLYIGASDYSRVTALDPATDRVRWATPVALPAR